MTDLLDQNEWHENIKTFALNTWLCDYPSDLTYRQIIDVLKKDVWGEPDQDWKTAGIRLSHDIEGQHGEYAAMRISTTFKQTLGLIIEVREGAK